MVTLGFYGAAGTVTGSKYLLDSGAGKTLIDCGLFQGLKQLRLLNWESPAFDPASVNGVVLTHAHLDHCGYLPRLVKQGFRGPIYCTPATLALCQLILLDSAHAQQRDADYANRKGYSRHQPALPLYNTADAKESLKLFQTVRRGKWFSPAERIQMQFHDAGHLLGSNMIEAKVEQDSKKNIRLVFSGDIGRYDAPLYHDPQPPPQCDYLICESTYGNRQHEPSDLLEQLTAIVERSVKRGGVLLVASFSVGRSQQLIYLLQVLMHEGTIPEMPIYLDSPMAIDATDIYREFSEDHDLSEGQLQQPSSVLDGPNLHLTRSVKQSKQINDIHGPAVIISAAGMMTGGRILHHLRRRLPDESNTILLGGFMAAGTRGRRLQDGEPTLRMHGRDVPVKAALEKLSGLSGHAGRDELLRWLGPLDRPRRVFLTHGEPESADALAATLREDRGWDVAVPQLGSSVVLETDE